MLLKRSAGIRSREQEEGFIQETVLRRSSSASMSKVKMICGEGWSEGGSFLIPVSSLFMIFFFLFNP